MTIRLEWYVPWIRTVVYPAIREMWGKYAYPVRLYRRWKRYNEKKTAERKALDRFWTDIICQAGESAVHAGQFSREQINQSYSLFGSKAGLTGLLPKQLALSRKDMRDLKSAILKRIGPEARQEFKEKKAVKSKRLSAKSIRSQFRRAFRNAA